MRSCLVLGSGRSGTSMVAGLMAKAGYFMGEQLHGARSANPRGFFEDATINSLNEALLAGSAPADLREGQRWLSDLSGPLAGTASPPAAAAIARLTARTPFCFKDPRLSYTLPLWRPHLPADTGLVCVFRHPALTAVSIVEECRRATYLSGVAMDTGRALRIWAAVYHSVLSQAAGEWLFVHYDQVIAGDGVERIAALTDAPLDAGFPDRTLRRPPPELAVPDDVMDLYRSLCERAGHREDARRVLAPRVSQIALARTTADLPETAAARGVEVELVVVDRSDDGTLDVPDGAAVVRAPGLSRGAAWAAGAAAAGSDIIALSVPGMWRLPHQLARGVAALAADPAAAMATCDYHLSPDGDRFTGRVQLAAHEDAPPPGWIGGVVIRREALAAIDTTAFFPSLLALYRSHRAAGTLHHIDEPLFAYDTARFSTGQADAAANAARLSTPDWSGQPLLTVSLCTYNRSSILRECLAALCRQNLPAGAFAVTVVNDGSTDQTAALLDGATFPIPVTVLHRDNGGLAAARNTGLAHTTTPLVLFINDDTIAPPDFIHAHLSAHAERPGGAVLGGFVQPAAEMGKALTAAVEAGGLMFCFEQLREQADNPPQFFYTCNVSAPTAALQAAGGFDSSFRHYGAEDTDMGLRLGLPIRYVPAATALHRHPYDFNYIKRRAIMVAAAHVRLWRKHPDQCTSPTLTVAAARQAIQQHAAALAAREEAARSLSGVSLTALRRSGQHRLADDIRRQLHALLTDLNGLWWLIGLADGLEAHGFIDMAELLAEHPLPAASGDVWVMAPQQDSDWGTVRDLFAARRPQATLALIPNVDGGLSVDELVAACATFDAPDAPALTIASTGLSAGHDVRLLAGATGWLRCGGSQDDRMARLARIAGCPEITLHR